MQLSKLLPTFPKDQKFQLDLVSESLDSLFLSRALDKKALLVVADLLQAQRFYEELSDLGERVYLLPEKENLRPGVFYSSEELLLERSAVLKEFDKGILITSVKGLGHGLPSRENFQKKELIFTLESQIGRDQLLDYLVQMGYERKEITERWGDFSVRGDICDVFVPGEEYPFRMEFFGDEIDGMRSFEPQSQRSKENLMEVRVFPALEEKLSKDAYLEDWVEDLFIYDELTCINRYKDYYKDTLLQGENGGEIDLPRGPEVLLDLFEKSRLVVNPHHQPLSENRLLVSVESRRNLDYRGRLGDFFEDLRKRKEYKQILLLSSKDSPLLSELKKENIVYEIAPDKPQEERLSIYFSSLSKGFVYQKKGLVLYTQAELLGGVKKKRQAHFQEDTLSISSFMDLKIGDYVVHLHHGIGRYGGVVQKQIEGQTRDYLEISYRGSDVLYIPSDQLAMIQRYLGSDARKVSLSKLGSQDWKRKKERAKKSIEDLTEQLLELYAKRESARGYAFSEDTPWQQQFEMDFIYEETPGQLKAIEAVKRDMESPRPMDRLLLGDVGFGKTEVALRGIFKAAMESKQSVFLVPTTVLCQQHYETMKARFSDYPIKIAALSRLTVPREKEEILRGLAQGTIDVVVGTHMVFGKQVQFKDLGLFIIDEEQRFGVVDKEKIRKLRTQVDTLSMSATPIPRTLHLSLGGIRDLSLLREAPKNRFPIQTYIARRDDSLIREAILRELERGGQIYYIFNRISGMEEVKTRLRKFFPQMVIASAHGKMKRQALEETMLDFRRGEIDLLLSTTIVETGMDISNVNTLIVEDAQNFGLSQLYQLRGRVGRSDRLAYAYLLYPAQGELSEEARNRLDTLREFTEFGSGFKIALRDMEIRGSGSILGSDQSGHFADIGYELYMEMLKEKASELKGQKVEVKKRAQLQYNSSAYIPSKYISAEETKMEIYRKINQIENREDLADLQEEITDRFGTMPEVVDELLTISYLSSLAGRMGFSEVILQKGLKLYFDESHPPSVEWVQRLHKLSPKGVQIRVGVRPFLFIEKEELTIEKAVKALESLDKLGQDASPKEEM
ncbi:MAG TPA: transcription-repair coupling factor [Clostridia bacterium]|nr:transcription-repair coupling factor [Clostridia bacterium]